jgi:hypothetical protein
MTLAIEKQVRNAAAQRRGNEDTPSVIHKSWGRVGAVALPYALHPDIGNGDLHDFRLMDGLDTSRDTSEVAAQLRRVADLLNNGS